MNCMVLGNKQYNTTVDTLYAQPRPCTIPNDMTAPDIRTITFTICDHAQALFFSQNDIYDLRIKKKNIQTNKEKR